MIYHGKQNQNPAIGANEKHSTVAGYYTVYILTTKSTMVQIEVQIEGVFSFSLKIFYLITSDVWAHA
jgi:hypothetical protein